MPVPSQHTWVDDEIVTASLLNTYLRDPQSWLLGLPTFVGWTTTQTNIPNATDTALPINQDDVNVGFTHSANSTNVTATIAGWYRFVVAVAFTAGTAGATGGRGLWLRKNGTIYHGGAWTGASALSTYEYTISGRSGYVYLNGSTDYAQLAAYQTSGQTLQTQDNSSGNWDWGNRTGLILVWQGRDA